MVVGCGLGDDAELLAQRGCRVTAFDVAESSIRWCRQRFPKSRVDYRVMDLFALPQDLCMRFDLVVEIYTLQSMPIEVRKRAYAPLVSLLTPGGALVVVSHGRDDGDAPDGPRRR